MPTFIRYIPVNDRTVKARVQRTVGETTVDEPVVYSSKLPGDSLALRGIPAIGRGVSGARRDTRPESVLDGHVPSEG